MRLALVFLLVVVAGCGDDEPLVETPDFSNCEAAVPLDSVPDRFVHPDFAILTPTALGDSLQAMDHCIVVDDDSRLHCFWTRGRGWDNGLSFGHASSRNLVDWELHDSIELRSTDAVIDRQWAPQVFRDEGAWHMYFTGVQLGVPLSASRQRIFHATSGDLFDWSGATLVLEPVHERTAWGTDLPFGSDGRDQIVFRSGDRWMMLLTVRLPDRQQGLALAERTGDGWSVVDVLASIRGEAIESPFLYSRNGRLHVLVNNWRDGGQALWTADGLDGPWTRSPQELRGFAWELLELDAGFVMASRVWGSSVMLTRIDLDDLGATNMVYPDCYTGSEPLLPPKTPAWEVELR